VDVEDGIREFRRRKFTRKILGDDLINIDGLRRIIQRALADFFECIGPRARRQEPRPSCRGEDLAAMTQFEQARIPVLRRGRNSPPRAIRRCQCGPPSGRLIFDGRQSSRWSARWAATAAFTALAGRLKEMKKRVAGCLEDFPTVLGGGFANERVMAGDRLFHVGAVLQPAHARSSMSVKRNVEKVVVDEPAGLHGSKDLPNATAVKCEWWPAPVPRVSTGLAIPFSRR